MPDSKTYDLDLDAIKDQPSIGMAQALQSLVSNAQIKSVFSESLSGMQNSIALAMKPYLEGSSRTISRQLAEAIKLTSAATAENWRSQLAKLASEGVINKYLASLRKITLPKIPNLSEITWPDTSLGVEEEQLTQELDAFGWEHTNLLEELVELVKSMSRAQAEPYIYSKHTGAVIINTNPPDAFNLCDVNENNDMKILFEICWEALEEGKQVNGSYEGVMLTRSNIIKEAINKGKQHANNLWITNTRNNLNKKLRKRSEFLSISTFDKKIDGYLFRRKIIINKSLNLTVVPALQPAN